MLLGFYKRFVPKIESGIKIHTIRNTPKRVPKIGERLYMYTGPYNEQRTLITNSHTLHSIYSVKIRIYLPSKVALIVIDNTILDLKQETEFALNDGFDSISDFLDYWISQAPKKVQKASPMILEFEGVLYSWTDLKY